MTPKEFRTKRGFAGIRKSAEAQPDNDTQGNQQDTGDKGAEAADVVDPFANAKADDVEDHENDEQRERS